MPPGSASTVDDRTAELFELAAGAKSASRTLAAATGKVRRDALLAIADELHQRRDLILIANQADCQRAMEKGTAAPRVDRLRLDDGRMSAMEAAVRTVAGLEDPLGQVAWGSVRPNGLSVSKIRVPLGVVFFIYESRPNVTTDAAALCLMSGNAVLLRGGSEAEQSNSALASAIQKGVERAGLPAACVSVAATADRNDIDRLLDLPQYIDLVVPRGGHELIERVVSRAKMPVLKHDRGVCHIYVDASADLEAAIRIVVNSKCQRPGVCNAAECLLVHHAVAPRLLPPLQAALVDQGVEMRACPRSKAFLSNAVTAEPADFGREFLDLILAVKVVDSLEDAVEHITKYGSGHTEAILTSDYSAARSFTSLVDASAVVVNASTRFNDGGELGLGAEIGISTGKFHARGPCGLTDLTTTKYIVLGSGQIRE